MSRFFNQEGVNQKTAKSSLQPRVLDNLVSKLTAISNIH